MKFLVFFSSLIFSIHCMAQGNLQFNQAITIVSGGNNTYTVPEGKVWKVNLVRVAVPTLTFGATSVVAVSINGIPVAQKFASGTSGNTASYCTSPTQATTPAYATLFDEFSNTVWLQAGSVITTFLGSPPTAGGTSCMGTMISGIEFNIIP